MILKIVSFLERFASYKTKKNIRYSVNKFKKKIITHFFSYTATDFDRKLSQIGLCQDDCLMVHSSWSIFNGFCGTPQDVIQILKTKVGPDGHLLMMSMPYTSATYEYFEKCTVFDVQKDRSRMGLMTEIFRRQFGVWRSFHPAHPVMVWGKNARWFIEGHETSIYSCGEGTPFEKMVQENAKILFFDVPFNTMTFFHHIEHIMRKHFAFSLYSNKLYTLSVKDYEGKERKVNAYTFSDYAVRNRNPCMLEQEMKKNNCFCWTKIGNTKIGIVKVGEAIKAADKMISEGRSFYDQ